MLGLGLATVLRQGEWRDYSGIEKALALGPVFYAAPLAVFAAEHFTATAAIASMVPKWIPGHLFWAYFVGCALGAASFSIAVGKLRATAGALLGLLILCFVLTIHAPLVASKPDNRFFWAVLLRDSSFSAAAFALSEIKWQGWVRWVFAVTMIVFGIEHFLHPNNVPIVPLELQMPDWIPVHWLWSGLAGAALLCSGIALIAMWHARQALAWLGAVAFAAVLGVYLPILLSKPTDIGGGMNYIADTLMFCGSILIVAAATSRSAGLWQDRLAQLVEPAGSRQEARQRG